MGWFRKHVADDAAVEAQTAAASSREKAEAELARQQEAQASEERHVVGPLRRIREKNHIAEDFIDMVRRGYS